MSYPNEPRIPVSSERGVVNGLLDRDRTRSGFLSLDYRGKAIGGLSLRVGGLIAVPSDFAYSGSIEFVGPGYVYGSWSGLVDRGYAVGNGATITLDRNLSPKVAIGDQVVATSESRPSQYALITAINGREISLDAPITGSVSIEIYDLTHSSQTLHYLDRDGDYRSTTVSTSFDRTTNKIRYTTSIAVDRGSPSSIGSISTHEITRIQGTRIDSRITIAA